MNWPLPFSRPDWILHCSLPPLWSYHRHCLHMSFYSLVDWPPMAASFLFPSSYERSMKAASPPRRLTLQVLPGAIGPQISVCHRHQSMSSFLFPLHQWKHHWKLTASHLTTFPDPEARPGSVDDLQQRCSTTCNQWRWTSSWLLDFAYVWFLAQKSCRSTSSDSFTNSSCSLNDPNSVFSAVIRDGKWEAARTRWNCLDESAPASTFCTHCSLCYGSVWC